MRNSTKRSGWLAVACICLFGGLPPAALAQLPLPPVQQLEEVSVEGRQLYQMRQRVVAAEVRFFALYNELNSNDDFDVHCASEAPIGTRITQRACRPVFQAKAEEVQAVAVLDQANGEGTGFAPPPALVLQTRAPEYQATLFKVVRENPKLLRLLQERNRLEERYTAARKKQFGGKAVSAAGN